MIAMQGQHAFSAVAKARGVSLIELMVGLLISALLMLGMYQIFSASRVTFQMQEGLSRVQENGRFAIDFLQRNLRMVGFMGCGNDIGRFQAASFVNHLANFDGSIPATTGHAYRFQRPIEAYTAGSMTATADFTAIAAASAPALRPVNGNDVLILRILGDESVPVLSIDKDGNGTQLTIRPASTTSPVLAAGTANTIYALQNCRSVDVFQAAMSSSNVVVLGLTTPNVYKDTSVTTCSNGVNGCPWDFRVSNAFLNARPLVGPAVLNGELHRAEYLGIYIRQNTNGIPSLYVRRFLRGGSGSGLAAIGDPEELAEGVERMLLRFGVDTDGDNAVDAYRTAAEVVSGIGSSDLLALDNAWRQVVSVRIGLLARSTESAVVTGTVNGDPRTYRVLGTELSVADDGRMRQVYETTVALRNRLLN